MAASAPAARRRVALIGTGLMGAPMGMRLLGAGHEVSVWNRSPDKAAPLVDAGAQLAADPAAACASAEIVVTMLTDAVAVEAVLLEPAVLAALGGRGALVVDMSSIAPARARELGASLRRAGAAMLDAPVSGGVVGARAGELTILVGGEASDFELAAGVLGCLGTPHLLGPLGSGQVAKCVNQLVVATTIACVAEGMLVARAAGLSPAALREALLGGFADSRVLREHGARMAEGDFVPGGTVANQVKDLRAVRELSGALGLEGPVGAFVTSLFESALADGYGSLDHSAVLLELAGSAGWPVKASA